MILRFMIAIFLVFFYSTSPTTQLKVAINWFWRWLDFGGRQSKY